jgi:hypothetical protein
MKIEICDVCGEQILDYNKPTRIVHQEYDVRNRVGCYCKVRQYDVCCNCKDRILSAFRRPYEEAK